MSLAPSPRWRDFPAVAVAEAAPSTPRNAGGVRVRGASTLAATNHGPQADLRSPTGPVLSGWRAIMELLSWSALGALPSAASLDAARGARIAAAAARAAHRRLRVIDRRPPPRPALRA